MALESRAPEALGTRDNLTWLLDGRVLDNTERGSTR
jgi:hypothetical protein